MSLSRELTAASAKPIVLGLLAQGDSYGYAIIQEVKRRSGGQIEWAEGALYPVLYRLAEQGMIESYWGKSEQGRRRKYYRIKPGGVKELEQQRRQWSLAHDVLNGLWGPKPCLT